MVRIVLSLCLFLAVTLPAMARGWSDDPNTPDGWAWTRIKEGALADFNERCGKLITGRNDPCRQLSARFLVSVLTERPWIDQVTRHGVRVLGARIVDDIDLSDADIAAEVWLHESRIDGSLYLNDARLKRIVSLDGSFVGGAFDMDRTVAEHDVLLRGKAYFAGDVSLSGAKIGGDLDLSSSSFARAVSADRLVVQGALLMRDHAVFAGSVLLADANVGSLDLQSASATNLDLAGLSAGTLVLNGLGWLCPTGSGAAGVDAAKHWRLGDAGWRTGCSGATAMQPGIALRSAHVAALQDSLDAWPPVVDLAGFHYDRLGGPESSGQDDMYVRPPEDWMDWLARDPTFSPQPYAQLATVLGAAGQFDAAAAIQYASRERERNALWNRSGVGPSEWFRRDFPAWLWQTVFAAVAGYGIGLYTLRVLFWALGLTILGSVVLQYSPAARTRSLLWRLGASLHCILPIVSLGREYTRFFDDDANTRLYGWQRTYFALSSLLGWLLGLFVIVAIGFPTRLFDLFANFGKLPEQERMVLAAAAALIAWSLFVVVLYVFAPGLLIPLQRQIAGRGIPAEAAKSLDKMLFGAFAVLRWLGTLLLFRLGSSERALDAWVSTHLYAAYASFEAHGLVRDRRIALDLPSRLSGTARRKAITLQQPWEELKALLNRPSLALLIAGQGGAGKTTLACEIARHAAVQQGRLLTPKPLVPLLIETDLPASTKPGESPTEDNDTRVDRLVTHLGGVLRNALHEPSEFPDWLTDALLRAGKLLVIVDGMSERSDETRQAFNPDRARFPIAKFIATSRNLEEKGMNAVLEPLGISAATLVDFVTGYLRASAERDPEMCMPDDATILESCATLRRLLRDKPTTALMATIWATRLALAGRPGADPGDAAAEIAGVAALFDSYVLLLLRPTSKGSEVVLQGLRADATAIAIFELGENFRPGYVTRDAALGAISARSPVDADKRMQQLEESRLLESVSLGRDAVRVAPDPVAEHLVARARVEALRGDDAAWRAFLADIERGGWPEDFVAAVAACTQNTIYGRYVPVWVRDRLSVGREMVALDLLVAG